MEQLSSSLSEVRPSRYGVVTLFGYGIVVRVDRGHLVVEDVVASDRKRARFSRVGHGLKRLIVIGSDGMVSLAALRWLADQDAAFVMLERDGTVLTTTGPVRSSDAGLRRAQAFAMQSGAALQSTRELISQKLAGQEEVARKKLLDEKTAEIIRRCRDAVPGTETIDAVLQLESQGAAAYFAAWRDLPIMFPKMDLPKVPDHWRTFGTRKSLLSGSPRMAVNPANAMLNYLYAVLESETRLALAALGMDPGLGFFHTDTAARDSLACDVMEAVRPQVDSYLLDWITREPLKRSWFFEQRDGNCRLMSELAVQLSQTAAIWAREVAPIAEKIARRLWLRKPPAESFGPPTRLTQARKRIVKGKPALPSTIPIPKRETLCLGCGKVIRNERKHCARCAVSAATEHLAAGARIGRKLAHTPEATSRRAATQRRNAIAQHSWRPSNQPAWLTDQVYSTEIQPRIAHTSTSDIAKQIGVSRWYAGRIRKGYRPHARHWEALAKLIGVSAGGMSTI